MASPSNVLVALREGRRVMARAAERSGRYTCPDKECGGEVILRQGTRRIAHFAHRPGSTCQWAEETLGHMQAKLDIAAEYGRRGLTVSIEEPVPSPTGDRRADVLIVSPRNPALRYAIEVQDSAIGEAELWRRTRAYRAVGVCPVWISLVRNELWQPAAEADGTQWVRKYSPRLHERWIEKLAGEAWLFDPEARRFWQARFHDHMLHREGVNFINTGMAEHIEVEPYDFPSGRWVDAIVTGPWKLGQIRISANPKRAIGTLTGQKREDS